MRRLGAKRVPARRKLATDESLKSSSWIVGKQRSNSVPAGLPVRTKPLARRTLPRGWYRQSWFSVQIICGSQGGVPV